MKARALAALTFAVLLFSMRFDPLGLGGVDDQLITYQADSEDMVVSRAVATRLYGFTSMGGFLIRRPVFWNVPEPTPYLSEPGLQGWLLGAWFGATATPIAQWVDQAYWVMAAASALAFALLVYALANALGLWAAAFCAALLTVSKYPVLFGRNLCWTEVLLVLPLAWGFLGYGKRGYLAGVFVTVFLRALCGFDFITNVVLGAATGSVFFLAQEGAPLRSAVKRVVRVLFAAGSGAVAALIVLIVQQWLFFGSFAKGRAHILEKLAQRTYGGPEMPEWAQRVNLLEYARMHALGPVPIVAVVLAGAVAVALALRGRLRPLAIATAYAAAASASWIVLFYNHLKPNHQFDAILFWLPLFPLVFALFGALTEGAVARARA